jgi:hypothetical protein
VSRLYSDLGFPPLGLDLPHSGLHDVDYGSSNRVIYRAQKQRTVIEISSDDDDDDGGTTPPAKTNRR